MRGTRGEATREAKSAAVSGGCGARMHGAGRKAVTVAVAGQPNCGKSTIFNKLTGSRQHVGNWPGKTVECREGLVETSEAGFRLVDLPGVYSLNANSVEEEIAGEFLSTGGVDVIIAVVNAASLRRTMYLVAEMAALGKPMVIALNMMDVAKAEGVDIAPDELARAVNCPVVSMSAARGVGVQELIRAVEYAWQGGEAGCIAPGISVPTQLTDHNASLSEDRGLPSGAATVEINCRWVNRVCAGAVRAAVEAEGTTAKWDRILLHPVWGRLLAWIGAPAAVLLGLSLGVLTGGKILRAVMEATPGIKAAYPGMLGSLFADGIIMGLAWNMALICFITFTYGIFCFLEDVGYLARMAYFFDGLLRRVGITGKSAIPMILGLVCNTVAMAGTRVVDTRRRRLITVAMVPFLPCAGQTFVAVMFIMAFFPFKTGLVMLSALTCVTLALSVGVGRLLHAVLPHSQGDGLIMELPLYHRPNTRTILTAVWTRISLFVRRVSGLIMAAVILVWAVGYFPEGNIETSFMYRFGQWLEPVAELMGMDWRFTVALLSSFVAKETTAGTLAVLFSLGAADGQTVSSAIAGAISPAGALAFVIASHLYVPCLATIAVLRSETGSWRWTGVQLALMFTLAFAMAMATYRVAGLFL